MTHYNTPKIIDEKTGMTIADVHRIVLENQLLKQENETLKNLIVRTNTAISSGHITKQEN